MTNHTTDAATMYALIEEQQDDIVRRQAAIVPRMALTWGLAWFVGFLALWLVDGASPAFALPVPTAIAVFVAANAAGVAVSAVLGVRSNRGYRPSRQDSFTGVVYGNTWSVGIIAILLLGWGLTTQGMPGTVAGHFYPAALVVFAGIMYITAGAIWQAVPCVVVGAVIVVIGALSTFMPAPWHFLFLAIAAGGSFLVLSVVALRWSRGTRGVTAGASA
ncbi:hypothetical protein BH10ACT7_BH10ACT7_14790 [soil metagenome]